MENSLNPGLLQARPQLLSRFHLIKSRQQHCLHTGIYSYGAGKQPEADYLKMAV